MRPRMEIYERRDVGQYHLSAGDWFSFVVAGNCYLPCPEIGISDRVTGQFHLFQHGDRRHSEMLDEVAWRLEMGCEGDDEGPVG